MFFIRSNLNKNFKFIKSFYNNQRCYTSALYVPGNKANKELSFLKPDINFEYVFNDLEKTEREFSLRGYKIDLQKLKINWDLYQSLLLKRDSLLKEIKKYSHEINNIKSNATLSDKSIDDLIQKSKLVKNDLKVIKANIWDIQETVIPELLKLPNGIDERTPLESEIVIKTVGERPAISEDEALDHISIGKNFGLLEYTNPIQYFLCDNAALLELALLDSVGKILKNIGIMRVAGPDFCRSIVVEGAGMDHEDPLKTFILEEGDKSVINQLHVVGSASLPGLLALYTKRVIDVKNLPVKIFNTGRQYVPVINNTGNYGLFSVCQASVAQVLILVPSNNHEIHENELQNLIEATSKIYDEIGSHYKVVIKPVKEIDAAESMRISFEMWSSYLGEYIEVGHISVHGEYLSKRLLIGCKASKKVNYAGVISGTLLSVPKVLGCLLEQNPKEFVMPEKMKGFLGFK